MKCPHCGAKAHKVTKRLTKAGLIQVYRCTNLDVDDKHPRHFSVPVENNPD